MSKQSKFLSLILRHKPEEIGITLDAQGWVFIDVLLRAMKKHGRKMSREELEEIVTTSEKKRFTISQNGRYIRAAQGHSIEIDLGLEPCKPPSFLYHGTAVANLDSIFAEGLKPGKRRHVHLSPDEETALKVGQRHGKPKVLFIETGVMHANGHLFYRADNGVWLTDYVPPVRIGFGVI